MKINYKFQCRAGLFKKCKCTILIIWWMIWFPAWTLMSSGPHVSPIWRYFRLLYFFFELATSWASNIPVVGRSCQQNITPMSHPDVLPCRTAFHPISSTADWVMLLLCQLVGLLTEPAVIFQQQVPIFAHQETLPPPFLSEAVLSLSPALH